MLRRFAPKAVLCYDPDAAGTGRGRAQLRAAGRRGLRRQRRAAARRAKIPIPIVQKRGREAYVAQLQQSRPYLEFLLDRAAAEHDLTRDDARREFLQEDARRRGPNSRSRPRAISSPIAWPTRRGSPKKWSERRSARPRPRGRPSCRSSGCASLSAPLRDVETGAAVGAGARAGRGGRASSPSSKMLILKDLGRKPCSKRRVELVAWAPEELPSALMERLSDQEAQLLSKVATEREPPVRDLDSCVADASRFERIERELGEIQAGNRPRLHRVNPAAPELMTSCCDRKTTRASWNARSGPETRIIDSLPSVVTAVPAFHTLRRTEGERPCRSKTSSMKYAN